MGAMSQSLTGEGISAAPEERPRRERLSSTRLKWEAKLFAAVLFLHVFVLSGLLTLDWVSRPLTLVQEEIPVEVVTEPPPQPPPQEPPAQQAQKQPKPPEPQPKQQPKQKLKLDEKPAYDAPRAENREQVKREAPDEATAAQRQARPDQSTAEKPEEHQQKQETQRDPGEQQGATDFAEEDTREAEIVKKAAPRPTEKVESMFGKPDPKAAIGPKQKSMSDLLASLEPTPHYRLGGAAKVSPISGGTAAPTYFSVVLGYILRKFHAPGGRQETGSIVFFVDPNGNLMHQALRKSSGSPARDQEALSALHRAQPFPPTPTGTSVGMVWNY